MADSNLEKKLNAEKRFILNIGIGVVLGGLGLPVTSYVNLLYKICKKVPEEWKNKYTHCAMGLRLDQDIDFDIDNELAKRFPKIKK